MANSTYYLTNHRKKESEVSKDDFYSTHPNSVNTFLDELTEKDPVSYYNLSTFPIWEPAAGGGNISKELLKRKRVPSGDPWEVVSTDLVDRGFCKGNINFLEQKNTPCDTINVIMTNPPYKCAEEFIRHAHTFDVKNIIMYLKLTFLEGKKRYELFKDFPLDSIWVHSSRQACDPEGKSTFNNTGATAYAWYIWKPKSTIQTTQLFWLPPN